MKDIGEKLKTSREEAGLSLEEAAEDLKFDFKKLQAVELGNKEVFKDIYDLKYYIRDYAKYLGLDYEKLMIEFNEFMFDYTSRIPVAQIEKASKEHANKEKKITSPYTIETKRSYSNIFKVIILVLVLLTIAITVLIFTNKSDNNNASIAALL